MDSKNVSKKSLKFNTAALWQKTVSIRVHLWPNFPRNQRLKNSYYFKKSVLIMGCNLIIITALC